MLTRTSLTFKICMLILILGMFVFSLVQLYKSYAIYSDGERTVGTIKAYKETKANPQSITGSDMTYAPIFTFLDSTGKEYTLNAGTYSKEKKYTIGEQVNVYYPNGKPIAAQIEGYFPWKMYSLLAGLGLVGIVLIGRDLRKNIKD